MSTSQSAVALQPMEILQEEHEFHETCHSVTFIVQVNSHQR